MKVLGRSAFLMVVLLNMVLSYGRQAEAVILFQDHFDDGDNTGWTTTIGNWSALSGHNEAIGLSGNQAYTYAGDPLWTDYTFDVDITFGTGTTEFYVAVRADPTSPLRVDGGRQYYLSVDGDNDIIRLRYHNGAEPTAYVNIQTTPYTLLDQTTYHMQINIMGNTIQASIDGNALFDYTFSGTDPIYHNGVVGIGYGGGTEGADGAFFDNVLVTGPSPIPEPSTWLLFSIALLGILGLCWRHQRRVDKARRTHQIGSGSVFRAGG